MKRVDYHMKSLYNFIEENYSDEEFLISLVSDHATSATIDTKSKASILCKEKTNVPFMIRGSGHKDINSLELIENVDILPSILSSCNIEFDEDSIDGKLPKELGGNGKDFIFTESIFAGQTYKASIKDDLYECFLEGTSPTDDSGEIDVTSYYFIVEDIKTGNTISDERIIKQYLLKFENVLKIEINCNGMLKSATN